MHTNTHKNGAKRIRSITYLSILVNVGLCILKLVVGIVGNSLALVADGIHSLSDLATDGAVLVGLYFGSKKPDQSHPYGHGRLETFSALSVSAVLILIGGGMIYYATMAIARDEVTVPHFAMGIAAIVSIGAKEWLYRATRKIAVESHSPALYANAWHHRSDALSSVAVLVGYVSLQLSFTHGDQVAAIAVGLMIVWVGATIISGALRELSESAIDADTIERIKEIINSDSSIRQWHQLRTRTVGREVFLDLHILVDPELDISAAHEISQRLEDTLEAEIARPINIVVHIEPDIPELRK